MDLNAIATIARQELIISIRNKWTLVFAGIFGVLVLAISYFGLVTAGEVGFQGLVRTSASLLNLVLYVVPLIGLSMGTLAFTSEKSSGELLYSQPVTRAEIVLGQLAGLFLSIFTATLFGFGLAGIVIATSTGTGGVLRYPLFVGFALWLALIFLGVAALVCAICQRQAKAFGVALLVWFFFLVLYDLLVIGVTFLLREWTANRFIFISLFGNPVDMVRVISLMVLDGKEIFGAAGAALIRFLGGEMASAMLLLVGLGVWAIAPVVIAQRLLRRQDI